MSLEISVSTKRFTDVSCTSMFSMKLDGFEVLYVVYDINEGFSITSIYKPDDGPELKNI